VKLKDTVLLAAALAATANIAASSDLVKKLKKVMEALRFT